jgi:hypothetical protein
MPYVIWWERKMVLFKKVLDETSDRRKKKKEVRPFLSCREAWKSADNYEKL